MRMSLSQSMQRGSRVKSSASSGEYSKVRCDTSLALALKGTFSQLEQEVARTLPLEAVRFCAEPSLLWTACHRWSTEGDVDKPLSLEVRCRSQVDTKPHHFFEDNFLFSRCGTKLQ